MHPLFAVIFALCSPHRLVMHQGGAVPETGHELDFGRDDHRRVRCAPHVLRGL